MAKQVMPEAELTPRASDVPMTNEEFLEISLFAQMKRPPSLDRYPGALVLRRFQPGEVLCRQGEAGYTAFYLLTSEDVLTILERKVPAAWKGSEFQEWQDKVDELRRRVAFLKGKPANAPERRLATVQLTVAPRRQRKKTWLQRLGQPFFAQDREPDQHPKTIVIDAPTDINYDTLQAVLYEGEVVGERSCLYGTPRSATIVADREIYAVEFLRNIYDQLLKDPGYKANVERIYRERIMQLHIRRLSIFSDLTEDQFNSIKKYLELVSFEPGALIFDEYERSDAMYVIRSGLVKVVKKVSALLHVGNIRSWPKLCAALRDGEAKPGSPRAKFWQYLSAKAQAVVRAVQDADPRVEDQWEILFCLNEALKDSGLADSAEFKELLGSADFQERTRDFAVDRKHLTAAEIRHVNRILCELVFAPVIRPYRRRVGPDCVLSYLTRGDFMGEMGLIANEPRSATCVAYAHPDATKETSQVELIRISAEVFQKIMDEVPSVRQKVAQKAAERKRLTEERSKAPVWEESNQVLLSERADKLGLIQGQRLMMIDLDRCTRCDECVRACVHTHDDGYSRLFLDGPRFDKYLIPTTCRSCLDPVCMIGCPVGSIHRGNNGQMVIEDWCIGCGLCAKNCPYGSIQMHDIGIIPDAARGWRWMPSELVNDVKWFRPRFNDSRWLVGQTPFDYDAEFREVLQPLAKRSGKSVSDFENKPFYFRYRFQVPGDLMAPGSQFKMEVASARADDLVIWINGVQVEGEKAKKEKREFWLPKSPQQQDRAPAEKRPQKPTKVQPLWKQGAKGTTPKPATPKKKPASDTIPLRTGWNVIAVKVVPDLQNSKTVLHLRLDPVNRPEIPSALSEEITEKLVSERAVVCDLCSSLPGKRPACVHACPHDAAIRVHAQLEFPIQ
ncbi:MAG: hypothetical protein KatS3mg105_3104 [Gemmatales bacterium]|nr:MAG: hypothetical protein KatS3mg105_3104 [Gemmatales bacterium]